MKKQYQWFIASALLVLISGSSYSQTDFVSLNYLYNIQGDYTVAGQHNREPNSDPDKWTEWVHDLTGNYPGLWSGDFLFQQSNIDNRWTMIYEAKEQWEHGALISILNHCCPPTMDEACAWEGGVLSSISDTEWTDLITDGGSLNTIWKQRMDNIAVYLQYLEDEGVEVLFRPFHEMNQGKFWWGGRTGPEGTVKLYQLTHDYLTIDKGLSNLIFVWNLQDFATLDTDVNDYYPGEDYYEVLSLDMYYSDGKGYSTDKYNAIKDRAGGKPIAIGECQTLPTIGLLSSQTDWTFMMPWAELLLEGQSEDAIKHLYDGQRIIVREEMPGWFPESADPEELSTMNNGISVFPSHVSDILNVDLGDHSNGSVEIFSPDGRLIFSDDLKQKESAIQVNSINYKGMAIVKVSSGEHNSAFKTIMNDY